MPCCCVRVLNLCNKPVCGELEIDQAAPIDGDYTLLLDYLGMSVPIVQEQTEGENLKFDVSELNENYQYSGQIIDSDSNVVPIIVGDVEYDCIKFKTIVRLGVQSGISDPEAEPEFNTVIIEAVIGEVPEISGTTHTVTGIEDGSALVISEAFAGVRVQIIRGNIPIPGIDPLDGSQYFTKLLASDTITLSNSLTLGEFLRIQTIPQ